MFIPLEANPEVFTEFISSLGAGTTFVFEDMWALDDELLPMMNPTAAKAVIFLYDINEKQLVHERDNFQFSNSSEAIFVKQYIGNACGTIALLHSIINQTDVEFEEGSLLHNLKASFVEGKTAEELGHMLEVDDDLEEQHQLAGASGQTEVPDDLNVSLHFIAFVKVGDQLLHFDGRKENPVLHGTTTEDRFLYDAAAAMKGMMAVDPENPNFSIIMMKKRE
ncbi:hypothetical protein PCE1_000569 [Barthelona sp. PCE]